MDLGELHRGTFVGGNLPRQSGCCGLLAWRSVAFDGLLRAPAAPGGFAALTMRCSGGRQQGGKTL